MHVFRVSETYRDNCNQGISIDRSTVHYAKLYSTCLLCRYHRQGSGRFWQLRERWRQKCDGGCCWPWYQRETGEGRGGLIGEEDLRLTDKSQRTRSRWSSVKGKLLTIPRADECRKNGAEDKISTSIHHSCLFEYVPYFSTSFNRAVNGIWRMTASEVDAT